MSDRKVAERRWTDAEHIALAEKQLEEAYRYFDKPDPLTAAILAAAHGAVARLASRSTTPDNEPEPSAVHAKRIHELNRRLDDATELASDWEREAARLEQHRDGLHAEVLDLRWLVGHLARNAPDTVMLPPRLASVVKECMEGYEPSRFTLAEPVPSTGEDQRMPLTCARCGHPDTEHGFPYDIECDAEGCICGAFEPVPDEGSETDGE